MAIETAARRQPRRLRVPAWATRQHPIFRAESTRRLGGPGLRRVQMMLGPLMLGTAGVIQALSLAIMLMLEGFEWSYAALTYSAVVFLLFVLMHVIMGLLTGIQSVALTAPLISAEVELQSWGLLRTTTLPLQEIVLAKLTAALHILRWPVILGVVLRVFSWLNFVMWIGAFYMERNVTYSSVVQQRSTLAATLPGLLPFILITLVFWALQPPINLAVNGALGLWASCRARNRGQAISLGLAVRLALWIGAIILNIAIVYGISYLVFGNWFQGQYAPLALFHQVRPPSQDQQISIVLGIISGYLLTYLSVQGGLALLLTGLALRRAARIGG